MPEPRTREPPRDLPPALDVLVVDDDPDTRAILSELLAHDGLRVRCAESTADALAALHDALPDVVVTDLALGAERGHDLAAQLRDDPRTRDVALVAITGSVDPHWDVVRFFDAYLVKPLDHRTFASLLRSLASSVSASRERLGR